MEAKRIAVALVMGVVCLLTAHLPAAASREQDEINNFYRNVVDLLKKTSHVKQLVALVEKTPRMAERCLSILRTEGSNPW